MGDSCQANTSVGASGTLPLDGPSSTFSGVVDGFEGPFSGMGISGYNDLGKHMVGGPAECADLCLDTALCSSFDYGARGNVEGECWLSTADRNSAGSAYTEWVYYDYYEMVSTADATPEVSSSQGVDNGVNLDNASSAHTNSVC